LFKSGAITFWILEMILDAILDLIVPKLIIRALDLYGAELLSLMLSKDQCLSLYH
jgi:hypothetical protein